MKKLLEALKKDAWLVVLFALCAFGCLLLGQGSTAAASSTAEEARLARVLSAMQGAGRVDVAVFYEDAENAVPCGAVVVADGAGDAAVQLRLARAVMTLLPLKADQIEVFQREED